MLKRYFANSGHTLAYHSVCKTIHVRAASMQLERPPYRTYLDEFVEVVYSVLFVLQSVLLFLQILARHRKSFGMFNSTLDTTSKNSAGRGISRHIGGPPLMLSIALRDTDHHGGGNQGLTKKIECAGRLRSLTLRFYYHSGRGPILE